MSSVSTRGWDREIPRLSRGAGNYRVRRTRFRRTFPAIARRWIANCTVASYFPASRLHRRKFKFARTSRATKDYRNNGRRRGESRAVPHSQLRWSISIVAFRALPGKRVRGERRARASGAKINLHRQSISTSRIHRRWIYIERGVYSEVMRNARSHECTYRNIAEESVWKWTIRLSELNGQTTVLHY